MAANKRTSLAPLTPSAPSNVVFLSPDRSAHALRTVVNMIVSMQAICRVGRLEEEEPGALFDAIQACLEKQESVVCPLLDTLNAEARHA